MSNGKFVPILNVGKKILSKNPKFLCLDQVYHTLSLSQNLLRVSRVCSNNDASIKFNSSFSFVKDRKSQPVPLQGGVKMDFIGSLLFHSYQIHIDLCVILVYN